MRHSWTEKKKNKLALEFVHDSSTPLCCLDQIPDISSSTVNESKFDLEVLKYATDIDQQLALMNHYMDSWITFYIQLNHDSWWDHCQDHRIDLSLFIQPKEYETMWPPTRTSVIRLPIALTCSPWGFFLKKKKSLIDGIGVAPSSWSCSNSMPKKLPFFGHQA